MIGFGKDEIVSAFAGSRVITSVYKGVKIIWQSVRSCFGSGAWIDDKPWVDDEGWKD